MKVKDRAGRYGVCANVARRARPDYSRADARGLIFIFADIFSYARVGESPGETRCVRVIIDLWKYYNRACSRTKTSEEKEIAREKDVSLAVLRSLLFSANVR